MPLIKNGAGMSSPANASDPVEAGTPLQNYGAALLQTQNRCHLDGPQLRTMTGFGW